MTTFLKISSRSMTLFALKTNWSYMKSDRSKVLSLQKWETWKILGPNSYDENWNLQVLCEEYHYLCNGKMFRYESKIVMETPPCLSMPIQKKANGENVKKRIETKIFVKRYLHWWISLLDMLQQRLLVFQTSVDVLWLAVELSNKYNKCSRF